jgi:hypothetical protein
MTEDLNSMLDRVHDEATFVAFIKALSEDFAEEREIEKREPSPPYGPGALGWENGSIDAFLEAAAAWASSPVQKEALRDPVNPWQRCAEILYAGKFHE